MNCKNYVKNLIKFIDNSPCAVWAFENALKMLKGFGFEEYSGNAELGKGYYIKGQTAIAAFIKGDNDVVRIGAAHLDSPAIMLKPQCNLPGENAYARLNCEVYGGAILSTWLDRPLGIAGRVMLKGNSLMPQIRLYDSKRPLCIIPNCAPHLNREINSGFIYNKQRDMLPLFSLSPKADIIEKIADDLHLSKTDILDFELYCYECNGGVLVGENEDMISIGRLDDLMMCYGLLSAITTVDTHNTSIILLTDNEEVGSLSIGGAKGSFPEAALKSILGDSYMKKKLDIMAFSADLAHAVNPSHPELHEPNSRPYLNRGMVLKRAANKSYSTDGISGAAFKYVCQAANIPYQEFVNPSDRPGGTTIGPMLSASLGIPTADIGAPIIAMHSIRELGGVNDAVDSYRVFKTFFEI